MSTHPGWPAQLVAGPVRLRPPRLRDGRAWSEVRLRNEQWLEPWEPTSPLRWADRNGSQRGPRCSRRCARRRARDDAAVHRHLRSRLVGQINVSNVVHGALRSCTVGYWVDGEVAGRSITPTALALVIDHCFTGVGLHRVEVDIRPENAASLRVVEKLGLRREGYYERFLDIDGALARSFRLCRDGRGARRAHHAVAATLAAADAAHAPLSTTVVVRVARAVDFALRGALYAPSGALLPPTERVTHDSTDGARRAR